METNPFAHSSPESSSAHDEDSTETDASKKKKKSRRLPLFGGGSEAKNEAKDTNPEKPDEKADASTLWHKLIAESTEKKTGKPDAQAKEAEKTAKKTDEADGSAWSTQFETASEQEAPLEALGPEEQAAVAAEYIAARRAEILAEQAKAEAADTAADETAAAERVADLALLEAMQAALEREAAKPAAHIEPLEEAYAATVQRLAELKPDAAGLEASGDAPATSALETPEPLPQDFPLDETVRSADYDIDDADDPTRVGSSATVPPTPVWQRSGSSANAGTRGTPTAPGSSGNGGGSGAAGLFAAGGGFSGAGPGANPLFNRPNVMPAPAAAVETVESRRAHTGSALLVGAVVGYLVGRRRGRIKTEKRLRAVEKKLTNQVEAARQQITEKEQQIRKLARETYRQKRQKLSYERSMDRPAERIEPAKLPLVAAMAAAAPAALRQERRALEPAAEVTPSSRPARPENQTTSRTERLGLGLVTLRAIEAAPPQPNRRETAPAMQSIEKNTTAAEKSAKAPTPEASPDLAKTSQTMNREELLKTGGEIRVGSTNLRRVYETNLISEQGLRRLVAVHERGGNVREVLEQELTEKEMSYERDPRLRNRSRSMVGALASSAVVRQQIDEPSKDSVSANDTVSGDAKSDKISPERSSQQPSQRATITAGIVMATVLAVLLYLLFTGKSL